MGFWKNVAKWTVAVLGSATTGALAATGFGITVAALTATWTASMTALLAMDSAEEDDRAKREEQLNQATDNANKAKDLKAILGSAEEDVQKAEEIRHKDKETITPEEQKDALERLTQSGIKVEGIALSVNPQKNDEDIAKTMQDIREKVSLERIAWRERLHDAYKIDMDLTQGEAQQQKNQLQDLLNKLEGKKGEEAQVLRSQIQEEIDYLEGKVSPEYQSFVDERRKEVEDLKTLKREHEEAFKKAKESVQNNAVTGVEDAEKALEKRAEFDSKFKEFLNQLRSKKEDLPHVLTPDILISIADFYSVFRDPELLHNEVFATAYKQQAERNEQVVFDTPLSAYRKAKEHLARSVELYKIYDKHIKNKEFTLARKLRFQVEAHQREAVRIAEQVPAKFSVWEGGTAKEKIATAWNGLKNAFKLGDKKSLVESLNSQINAHGDKIHKAMHLADLGEDDFYRNGLEATKNYFIQDGIKSQARSALIQDVEAKIPNLDARERAVESQAGVGVSERLWEEEQEQARIKAEEAQKQEESRIKREAKEEQEADQTRIKTEEQENQEPNTEPRAEEEAQLKADAEAKEEADVKEEERKNQIKSEDDDEEFESNLEARLNALGSGSVFEENDGDEGEQEEPTPESPMLESPMLEGGEDTHASVFSQYASTLAKDKEEEQVRLKGKEQEEAQKQEEERKAQIKFEEETRLKAAEQDKKIEQKLKSGFQRNEQEDDEEFESNLEARLNALGSDSVSEEDDEYVSDRLRAELLSDDLEEKLQALRDLPDPEPPLSPPSEALREPVITQQYQQTVAERERYLTSVEDNDDDLRVYGVSRKDGKLVQRLLKKGEKPRADEGTAYGYDCIIRLPPIDTGDAFNNFSGKKIRIFKGSIKVINTSDVEVGVYGEEMHPIEELIGSPKTGEFTFPIYSNSQYLPELVIKHKGEHSHFHLTSVTTHFSVED